MFAVFRLHKTIAVLTVALLTALTVTLACALPAAASAHAVVVAVDPGHGGYDGGVTGLRTHVRECDVNLSIALYLAAYLRGEGYRVVLTRKADRAPVEAGSLKRKDMDMRLTTIRQASADIAVSIHCNFYPSAYRRGIQVFYNKEADLPLATTLQNHLNDTQNTPTLGRTFAPLWGDYYILNKAPCPAAIVECGFLSNPEDEALLADEGYRMTLAYQIFCAIDDGYAGQEKANLSI